MLEQTLKKVNEQVEYWESKKKQNEEEIEKALTWAKEALQKNDARLMVQIAETLADVKTNLQIWTWAQKKVQKVVDGNMSPEISMYQIVNKQRDNLNRSTAVRPMEDGYYQHIQDTEIKVLHEIADLVSTEMYVKSAQTYKE